jgi:hypothetical protein
MSSRQQLEEVIETRPCVRCDGSGQLVARGQVADDADAEHGSRPCPRCKGAGLEMTFATPRSPLLEVHVLFEDETEARAFIASLAPSGVRHGIRLIDHLRAQFGEGASGDHAT